MTERYRFGSIIIDEKEYHSDVIVHPNRVDDKNSSQPRTSPVDGDWDPLVEGWLDSWRNATVAIERPRKTASRSSRRGAAGNPEFVIVGTGLMVALHDDATRLCLVTAKHVFNDPTEHWDPAQLYVRFSWFDEHMPEGALGLRIDLKRGRKRLWLSHPNKEVDLACLPLFSKLRKSLRSHLPSISSNDLTTATEIDQGVPVIVLGYPGIGPDMEPRAMVRQGIVSWVPRTKRTERPFLVDCHVFPGDSGGPVLKLPSAIDRPSDQWSGQGAPCVGIVTQARIQNIPLIAAGKEVEITFKGKRRAAMLFAPNFMPIGVVEPVIRIKQLLAGAARLLKR